MIVFWVALLAIAVIVQLKRREIKTGKSSFLTVWGVKMNDKLRFWYRGTRNFFSKKTWVLITAWCRGQLARTVSKTEKVVVGSYTAVKKHPRVAKILRGHTDIKNGGEASPFLKNISENDTLERKE